MITWRKFQTLRPQTRVRKAVKLLREAQVLLSKGEDFDWGLWEPFLKDGWALAGSPGGDFTYKFPVEDRDLQGLIRDLDRWRHAILTDLGIDTAEWDFSLSPRDGEARNLQRFPLDLFLEDLRSPFNVGSIFRTAEAFGARSLILGGQTPGPEHLRVKKTAMGTEVLLPSTRATLEELAGRPGIFALEMGGTPLEEFQFPKEGICLLGTEELGLSPEALALADSSAGRVTIPLYGRKSSLNVGVAAGILMAAWVRKTL